MPCFAAKCTVLVCRLVKRRLMKATNKRVVFDDLNNCRIHASGGKVARTFFEEILVFMDKFG